MLPSRSRLQSWNPDSLAGAAATIKSAGESIYNAVVKLDDRIDGMPEARGWEVADRPRNGRRSTGAVYLLTGDGHSREIPSSWYTPGGQALGEYVRFYWQHPEARDELSDSRAVERLKLQSRGKAG